jgi:RAB protein geranylgeranyltransferase component A
MLCAFAHIQWQVPATPEEALKTSLMGIFEKRRFRSFLVYLNAYEEDQPATYQGEYMYIHIQNGYCI